MHLARLTAVTATATAVTAVLAIPTPAAAEPGPLEVKAEVDVSITIGAAGGAYLLSLLRHNAEPDPWRRELLGSVDARVKRNYSERMRTMSDVGLVTSVVVPAALALGTDFDRGAAERGLVYTESLAGALLLVSATKTLVGRPRPYTYSADPRAQAHARRKGRDARRSFFSGHSTTAFASVAAGAALYAGHESDRTRRAAAWGSGALLAAATANLRVRAGEHFYSDVLVGALIGTAVGTAIPAVHTGGAYAPSGGEWAAIAGGLVLGVTASELLPLGGSGGAGDEAPRAELAPLVLPGGGTGLGVLGTF
jgi:membrane-associated phospholipid phosphatase